MPISELIRLGTARPIIRWSAPILHRSARPVTDFGADLQALLADMFATNTAANGAGLAAQQIGVDLAVFVYDCADETGTRRTGVVCNPTVVLPDVTDRSLVDFGEGCLSLPGAFADYARPARATCRGRDQYGDLIEMTAGGTLVVAFSTRPTTSTASCSAIGFRPAHARCSTATTTKSPTNTEATGRSTNSSHGTELVVAGVDSAQT